MSRPKLTAAQAKASAKRRRAYMKAYLRSKKRKAYMKAYRQRESYKAYMREYHAAYRRRFDKVAKP